jgi:hypothetical protein
MNKQTKETAEAILATPKASGYVILANDTRLKSKDQATILADLIQERFGVKGVVVTNDYSGDKIERVNATPEQCRGKILIGSLVPSYLAIVAKEVIEVNSTPFFKAPARFIKDFSSEEKSELLTYPKSYKVVATDIKAHEPVVAAETM